MYCLQVRKFTYQFCRRVPLDLRLKFPNPTIRHSLQTKDYSEAKRRRNTLLVHYDNEFQRLRLNLNSSALSAVNVCVSSPATPVPNLRLASQYIDEQVVIGKSMTLSDLSAFYMAKLRLGGNKKTIQDFSSSIDVALQYFGSDINASSINREMVRAFMLFLAKLPVRFALSKKTRGRPIQEVVEIAGQLSLKRSSIPTVNKRLDVLRAVFSYGVEEDKVAKNPFVNLRMKEAKKAKSKRQPMGEHDLTKLFNGLTRGSEDFWVTLIAAYQGARQNEILQLRREDIFKERDTWVISFHDRFDDNSLKTESSVRVVPIHHHLISLGLADWGAAIGKGQRLFQSASLGVYGNYSQAYSKHINAVFRSLRVTNHFHSLRHSFRDACREAEVPSDIADYLGGWAGSASVSRSYGALEFSLSHMKRQLNKVSYLS
jgi:integrase